MLEVVVRILAVVTLVKAAVVLNGAGNPKFNLSSGSAEAEIYLSSDEDEKTVISKMQDTRYEEKKEHMNKWLSPMIGQTVKSSDSGTRKPWRNLFDRLSDVSETSSVAERDQGNPSLRIIVNDEEEQVEEPKAENSGVKSIREQIDIAQRWFPILLRRAILNMRSNNTKKELNELVERLTFLTWKSEDFNGSEQKFVDWMLTAPFHARERSESDEDSEQRLLQKRSNCCSCCSPNERPSCQPCIVNIFNNSQIGYVVLGSDRKLPCTGCSHVDCASLDDCQPLNYSIVLPSVSGLCSQPNAINVEYTPNCESLPVVTGCITTTTTTEASCEDPLPYVQYETSTAASYNCKCSTPSSYQPSPPPPPSFYQTPCHHEHSPHPRPIYPWYNYPEPEYRPKTANYGPDSFEDHYNPYKNIPFDISSAEIEDCSREVLDYSTNYHVKRDPQYMEKDWIYKPPAQKNPTYATAIPDQQPAIIGLPPLPSQKLRQDPNLRNTLAKIGLSLNSERPAEAKTLEPSQYYQEDRVISPLRTQQNSPKFNS